MQSKMDAHLEDLVIVETHSLTLTTHFDTKIGLLSLLEA